MNQNLNIWSIYYYYAGYFYMKTVFSPLKYLALGSPTCYHINLPILHCNEIIGDNVEDIEMLIKGKEKFYIS